MGFFGAQSHRMIETDSCHLQSEAMQKTLVAACAFLTKLGSALAIKVHHVIVRESAMNGEQLVVFASHANSAELKRALIRFKAADVTTVGLTVQPKIGGPVWGRTVEILRGTGMLQERIGGILFRVSPRSFLQVQTPLAEQMYATVRDYAALTPEDTVIDAYCGIGTMTLMLAQTARHAIGVEEVAAAVADARANQADNSIQNAEFVAGSVETWLPKWVADGNRADVAVFDPPRKGIDPAALAAVAEVAPRRIVYASCNPATLQRDLKYLMEHGYAVEAMQPLDMFPQTSHVECCVSLIRK
jgi:23S rRNA (uracil1939-C5)-methyltransferase